MQSLLLRPTLCLLVTALCSFSGTERPPGCDATSRQNLPEYQVIPPASVEELTPAVGDENPAEFRGWARSHGTGSLRYSSLDQINRENVLQLKVAWTYRSGDGPGNIQSNPIIVDGIMYAPTTGDNVVAIDAETGREIWRFHPGGHPAMRGLVYWDGGGRHPGRVYFTAGPYLFAVDARTGKPVPTFGQSGKVKAGGVVAPAIFDNVIVVPVWNRVEGIDVYTGEHLWTFRIVPAAGEFGADTWSGEGDGANCWGGMAMDARRGIAYVAAGAPHPNFMGMGRTGANLFGDSVIALDARSGRRLWHFQEIRHDIWDLDIPAPPNLVTVNHGGRRVDAVAQVTKLGNTLLLDRVSGKPLFPFRLHKAPASTMPGECTWPYQPALELPEPFARQVFNLDEVTNISPAARVSVLKQLAHANYGWFQPFDEGKPTALYGIHGGAEWTGAAFDPPTGMLYVSSNEVPWIITVSRRTRKPVRDANAPPTAGMKVYQTYCVVCHGSRREGRGMAPPLDSLERRYDDQSLSALIRKGRNAMPGFGSLSAADMRVLLDYLSDRDIPAGRPSANGGAPEYVFNGYPKLLDHEGYPGSRPPWGTLNAINLNTGRIAWKIPLGEHEELTRRGIPVTGTENFGGPIVTAGGLVFCAGTRDLKIRAFDKWNGRELWSHRLPYGGYAPPATYTVKGRQYVVIAATSGGKLGGEMGDMYVAFALPPPK